LVRSGRSESVGGRTQKRAANRDRILRAARKVFGARGFHAATIDQIAHEAGLSNGAIYYNFHNKADLFFALLDERLDGRIRHLQQTLATAPQSGARDVWLEEEARDATRSLTESREWRLLLFEFIAHAARTPNLAPKLQAHKRRFRTALADVFEQRYTQHGTAAPLPIDDLARAALALANGLALEEVSDPGSVPEDLLGDLVERLFAEPS
jgi:AcrR family transcriptional regulator